MFKKRRDIIQGGGVRSEINNIRDVWYEGYQRLLEEAQARASVQILPATDERRRHPRFRVRSRDVGTPREPVVAVQDMSISGVCFEGQADYYPARQLILSLANVFSTESDVVACERLPRVAPEAPVRFRVRCRFRDEEHGLQFLTLTLELERVERE
jgi:hypothetical protein